MYEQQYHQRYHTTQSIAQDSLIDVFGMREMELAVSVIIRLCIAYGSWKYRFERKDFEGDKTGYTIDGFEELIEARWLVQTDRDFIENKYSVHPSLIHRLKQKRPEAFK